MFESVDTDNFSAKVLREKIPVLLARICRDYDYKEQTRVLGSVSKAYSERLKTCLLDENSVGTLRKFGIDGSPAFVIFHAGQEKGRMLGKANRDTLDSFVSGILSRLPDEQEMARVLVVDHEEATRCVCQQLLVEAGYAVSLAERETDAREILSSSEFDVAVVDRILHGKKSGLELVNDIRALQPSCEVIMISRYSEPRSLSDIPGEESMACLTKPMKKDEIIHAVEKAAEKSKAKKNARRSPFVAGAQP